jgi:hypothetical protein
MSDEAPQRIEVQFAAEKETKNTIMFREYVPFGAEPRIGMIYIQKATLKQLDFPERIRITVEADDTSREPRGRLGEEKPHA